ncbi:MAG: hypothetical protein DRJ67_01050 [Thermoprotei archaeon]|nr:MAG: hypothetical protein DRJ67_01050 [Thermoprotei archaeon]
MTRKWLDTPFTCKSLREQEEIIINLLKKFLRVQKGNMALLRPGKLAKYIPDRLSPHHLRMIYDVIKQHIQENGGVLVDGDVWVIWEEGRDGRQRRYMILQRIKP